MPVNDAMDNSINQDTIPGIAPDMETYNYIDGKWQKLSLAVPREIALTIYVNNQELVSSLCTPNKLNCLVLGYLYSENVISGMSDVLSMRICEEESLADIRLNKTDFVLPQKRILTSGCGGGVSLTSDEPETIISGLKVMPSQIINLMEKMLMEADIYRISGGIHTSALCDEENILVISEDIGRHNTLDKIQGECLLRKLSTNNRIIVTSGRLSSEMVRKAGKMETPVIASLTSPTERAIILAKKLGITLIGYTKGKRMSVYSISERLRSI